MNSTRETYFSFTRRLGANHNEVIGYVPQKRQGLFGSPHFVHNPSFFSQKLDDEGAALGF
jgi:hypothetical protein